MIRRLVEYVIVCDAKPECPSRSNVAYGSPTLSDCESVATQYGWKRISSRRWLCPNCAAQCDTRKYDTCAADGDGECVASYCPQIADSEPESTGRHCPLDKVSEDR